MATSKKPSAAQLAARKKFSEIMKAGGFAKKRAAKKTVAKKRVAKKNPIVLISDTPKKAARKTVRKANPVKKTVVKKGSANFPFVVEVMRLVPGGHVWEMHAGLNTKAEASDLAYLIAENYPNVSVRVKSYK